MGIEQKSAVDATNAVSSSSGTKIPVWPSRIVSRFPETA
jgi:hypothetical protein